MHTPRIGTKELGTSIRLGVGEVEKEDERRQIAHYKKHRRDLLETKIEEYINLYW